MCRSDVTPSKGGDVGEFGELSFGRYRVVPLTDKEKKSKNSNINLGITSELKVNKDNTGNLIHSNILRSSTRGRRSGRMLVRSASEIEQYIGASLLPIDILKGDIPSEKYYRPEEFIGNFYLEEEDRALNTSWVYVEDGSYDVSDVGIYIIDDTKDINLPSGDEMVACLRSEPVQVDGGKQEEEYIISPTGEKLDVKSKTGSRHLHRDISRHTCDIDVFRDIRLTARRSTKSATRGNRGKMSGILDHVISCMAYSSELSPYDPICDMSFLGDVNPNDVCKDPFYSPGFDIEVYRDHEVGGYKYLDQLDKVIPHSYVVVENTKEVADVRVYVETGKGYIDKPFPGEYETT